MAGLVLVMVSVVCDGFIIVVGVWVGFVAVCWFFSCRGYFGALNTFSMTSVLTLKPICTRVSSDAASSSLFICPDSNIILRTLRVPMTFRPRALAFLRARRSSSTT